MPLMFRRVSFVSFVSFVSLIFKRVKSVLIEVPRLIFGDFVFKFHDDEVFT